MPVIIYYTDTAWIMCKNKKSGRDILYPTKYIYNNTFQYLLVMIFYFRLPSSYPSHSILAEPSAIALPFPHRRSLDTF